MGMEAVFACGFMGENNYKIFLTLNGKNTNVPIFDSMTSPTPIIKNPVVVESRSAIETEPRVLCSFDIPSNFTINFSPYYSVWTTRNMTKKLDYDLKTGKYFVLLATGTTQ